MSETNYITFIDNAGRAIFGVAKTETEHAVHVQNPVMIGVQQQENGRMAVQLYPLFFAEFVTPVGESQTRHNTFIYSKNLIAIGDGFSLDQRIIDQYEKVVNPVLVTASEPEPKVIKLFDDE